MGPKPQPFKLPDQALPALTAMLNKGIHRARKLNRARILLKLDQGLGPTQIAREVGLSIGTVCNIRNKARLMGWQDALEDQPRSGRPPEISGNAKAKITTLACSNPPTGRGRWTYRLLADRAVELGYIEKISHESVRTVLKKTNSSPT